MSGVPASLSVGSASEGSLGAGPASGTPPSSMSVDGVCGASSPDVGVGSARLRVGRRGGAVGARPAETSSCGVARGVVRGVRRATPASRASAPSSRWPPSWAAPGDAQPSSIANAIGPSHLTR